MIDENGGKPLQFFPIDIGAYRHHSALATGPEIEGVAALLRPFGAEIDRWDVPEEQRGFDVVQERLQKWSNPESESDTFLYWVGHGESDDGSTALLAHALSPRPLTANGMDPAEFVRALAARQGHRNGSGWAIIVIDACKSARFVQLMSAHAHLNPTGAENFLLVATSKDGVTNLGKFRKALATVLNVTFPAQDSIDLRDLATELNRNLHGCPAIPHTDAGRATLRRRWPALAGNLHTSLDLLAEIESVLDTLSDDERRHFVPKASGAELGEQTWYFEGRGEERRGVLSWLASTRQGMLVVAGAAGAGKSALLGHVLVHTRSDLRRILEQAGQLEPLPADTPKPTSSFDAVIHLTGATPRNLIVRLAEAAAIDIPLHHLPITEQVSSLLADLQRDRRRYFKRPPKPFSVLVDALDEAHLPLVIAREILVPLSELRGVRVVIGTRRSTREGPDFPTPQHHDLLEALGTSESSTVITVGRDSDAMTRYVWRRLVAAQSRGTLTAELPQIELVSKAIGELDREFLYARLAVHEIIQNPEMINNVHALLESDHRRLFAYAVERLAGLAPANRALLAALSLAQGNGLPIRDGVWSCAASALASELGTPGSLTDSDIEALAEVASPYIMLTTESGQSVYRLAHRTFDEHFAQLYRGSVAARMHRAIAGRLAIEADGALPAVQLNPYVVRYLSVHAGFGGKQAWEELADHRHVLDRLDARHVARSVMSTAFGRFELPASIVEVIDFQSFSARPHVRGSSLQRGTINMSITSHSSWVRAISVLYGCDGSVKLASVGDDGNVRIWDSTAGAVTATLTGHADWVRSVTAFTRPDGRTLLATGSDDYTVRIWDPESGTELAICTGYAGWVRAVSSFTSADGRTILITSGNEKVIRVWDLDSGTEAALLVGHASWVNTIAPFESHDGSVWIATGDDNGIICIWDPLTGNRIAALNGHESWISEITAVPTEGGRSLIVTVGGDGAIKIWDPINCSQVASMIKPGVQLNAVTTFTSSYGETLIATGGDDGVVRIWDPVSCDEVDTLSGHSGTVNAVSAVTMAGGHTLLATGGGDGTVRIWAPGVWTDWWASRKDD